MADSDELAQVKVFRFDPAIDKEPRYEVYQTPYQGLTVLNVLQYIFEHYDASLSFRFGCAGAGYERCGTCPVLVNGTPAFSCKRLAEERMTIEPHPKYEVVKDLVIDFNRERKWLAKRAVAVEIVVDPEKCDGCRDCVLLCPLGVYEVQKVKGRAKAVPVDIESCCGVTCKQCAIFCKNSAITVKAKQ